MEILRIIHETRNLEDEQVSTAKIYLAGGISQEELDALPLSQEQLSSYTELIEHCLVYRQPADQVLVEARQMNQFLEGKVTALTQQTSNLTEEKQQLTEEVNELSGRLTGLISPPIQGESWDISKRYTRGDTVKENETAYVCLRFCRGKQPSLSPEYWAVKEVSTGVLVWSDLETNINIPVDSLVTHNEKTWICTKAHTKSLLRQPSAFSDYWKEAQP